MQQHEGSGTLALCTYPEALVEKVVGQKTLTESILKLHVGERLATSFVEEVLTSNRFERVEFVYEPGQYSIRGGIIDIFSYSSNVPYRIDFFGDEIDSIRPFDISTQLSTGKLEEVEIVPNLKDSEQGQRVSFAEFAGPVTYWMADGAYTLKRFDEIRTKMLGDTEHPEEIGQRVTSRKEFLRDSEESAFVLLKDNITERPDGEDHYVHDGSAAPIQQEVRAAGRRYPDTSGAGIRDLFPDGEQGPDRTARKYFQFDRRETHSFRIGSDYAPCRFYRSRDPQVFFIRIIRFSTAISGTGSGASSIGVKALPFRSSIR